MNVEGIAVHFEGQGVRKVIPIGYEQQRMLGRSSEGPTRYVPVFDLPGWRVEGVVGGKGYDFVAYRDPGG